MNVLLIRNAATHDFGGGERFPVDLASEISKYSFHPIVISRSPRLLEYAQDRNITHLRGLWWSKQNWSGAHILYLPLYIIWQIVLMFWYLFIIIRYRASIIHIQSKDDFIAATLAAKLLRKHIIWTDHADLKYIYQNHTVWYKNPIGKVVFWCSKQAHKVTLVSDSEYNLIKSSLHRRMLPENYVVIHNGVVDTEVTPAQKPKGKLVICATSRLVTAKGIGELITAFQNLQKKHSNILLWLVGDGPDAAKFKQQASQNPAIIFFGHKADPLSYVAAADIFAHPSHHEGFSISIIESAMLAKPIVACNVGGNPEIISNNKTGLLIPKQDISALEKALEILIEDHNKSRTLGENARKRYLEHFQFDTIVKREFVKIYEQD